jgi:hypothetical protein
MKGKQQNGIDGNDKTVCNDEVHSHQLMHSVKFKTFVVKHKNQRR